MTSRQEVVGLLSEMLSELEQEGGVKWENNTLPRFLEAMCAWLTDAQFEDQSGVSWDLVKDLLIAGKVYE